MVLIRKGLEAGPITAYRSSNLMWAAATLRVKGHTIMMVSAYLPPGEEGINATTISELSRLTTVITAPYIIGGGL